MWLFCDGLGSTAPSSEGAFTSHGRDTHASLAAVSSGKTQDQPRLKTLDWAVHVCWTVRCSVMRSKLQSFQLRMSSLLRGNVSRGPARGPSPPWDRAQCLNASQVTEPPVSLSLSLSLSPKTDSPDAAERTCNTKQDTFIMIQDSRTLFVTHILYMDGYAVRWKVAMLSGMCKKNTKDNLNWRDQNQNIYNLKKSSRNEKYKTYN